MENLIPHWQKWKTELADFLPTSSLRAYLPASRGAVLLPYSSRLSRTHTRRLGLELEIPAPLPSGVLGIGIDVESATRKFHPTVLPRLERRISPRDDESVLSQLDFLERWAIKEACYKACFPQPAGLLLSNFTLVAPRPEGDALPLRKISGFARTEATPSPFLASCEFLLLSDSFWKVAFAKRVD